MEEKLVTYKDLECKLIIEDSKKYLIVKKIIDDENESNEKLIEKAKKYGFAGSEDGLKLRVYNCFQDYEIDKEYNLCRGASVGKFVLSESEIIYAFQMEGCGFSNRFWQITYEEYINYKEWENDEEFIRELTATRLSLEPYFSRKDLFKTIIEDKDENGNCKGYCLEYSQKPYVVITVNIYGDKTEESPIRFRQSKKMNLDKVNIDEENFGLLQGFYNGYECLCCTTRDMVDFGVELDDYAFYKWNTFEKIVKFTLAKNCSIEDERKAIKLAILELDRKILKDKIDKVILIANEYINDNIYTEFMNTLIKNYTSGIVAGGCRAYSYSYPYTGDDREKKLLKIMRDAEQIEQRLRDNMKKYNIQEEDAQQQSKDDFLNSYYK